MVVVGSGGKPSLPAALAALGKRPSRGGASSSPTPATRCVTAGLWIRDERRGARRASRLAANCSATAARPSLTARARIAIS